MTIKECNLNHKLDFFHQLSVTSISFKRICISLTFLEISLLVEHLMCFHLLAFCEVDYPSNFRFKTCIILIDQIDQKFDHIATHILLFIDILFS